MKISKEHLKRIVREELKSLSEKEISLSGKEVANRIKNSKDKNHKMFFGKKALIKHYMTENENIKTHADITKAKNLLGYDPKVFFDEGIERFLDWHKNYENI